MDKLDEAVEVFRRDIFVLLIEVVHVAVENFDEQLHGYGSVHASVCDAESALETFENTLAVTIYLR